MEILCEPAEIVDVTHNMSSVTRQYPISRPRAWVLFTYDEYRYFEKLWHLVGSHVCADLYATGIYEQMCGQVPHVKIPLEYVTKYLRLFILADHTNPNRQEEFIPDLRKMLSVVGL